MRSVIYSMLILAAALGVAALADYRLPYLLVIVLYLAIYAVVDGVRRRRQVDGPLAGEEWPTSGPIGRLGQRGLAVTFALTGLLALLNPFQLAQIIRQAIGDRRAERRSSTDDETRIVYALPPSPASGLSTTAAQQKPPLTPGMSLPKGTHTSSWSPTITSNDTPGREPAWPTTTPTGNRSSPQPTGPSSQ